MEVIAYLGRQLQALRARHGLSQYELAKRAGIPQTTLWRVENGKQQRIDATIVVHLARVLGVSTDYLLGTHEDDVEEGAAALATVGA